MQNLFTRFIEDESGATAIEYGLIAALIAVGMIVGAGAVGTKVNAKFVDIGTKLDNSSTAEPAS
ncbi:MAG: Flp family type IVb pilin [Litorimonas sp.]